MIDWARYSRRDLIFEIFHTIYIPETVLGEIRSESTIYWITENMARDRIALFTETPEIREEAIRIMRESRRYPIKSIDYPEALCISIGKMLGIIVLSENGGAYFSQYIYLRGLSVWRAFEVLLELYKRGLIERSEFTRYQVETHHRFPRRDLEALGIGETF
ncbi:MAG: hypothetical protein RQ885_10705 [Desulfurococcales archaeon]|nr:hypothetical protein [Desulfurococcales archaeon]